MQESCNFIQIGRIPFFVCAPFFAQSLDTSDLGFVFTDGVPSELNRLLSENKIDLAPTSSIEYAQKPQDYLILPDWCTSCLMEVRSVLLFSKVPLNQLNHAQVALTPASHSSINLLKILFNEYKITASFLTLPPGCSQNEAQKHKAYLEIGDAALQTSASKSWPYVYDLGSLWQELTGLPFVFAVWIIHKNAWNSPTKKALILEWKAQIEKNISAFRAEPQKWVNRWRSQYPSLLDPQLLLEYFNVLDYHFSPERVQSVELFWQKAYELGLCESAPKVVWAE